MNHLLANNLQKEISFVGFVELVYLQKSVKKYHSVLIIKYETKWIKKRYLVNESNYRIRKERPTKFEIV